MVKFYPTFGVGLGESGESTIYVKDSNNDWQKFDNYEYFKVVKKQNQVSEFEVKMYDIQDAERSYVKEFAEIAFFSENNLILKGRIQKIKYETSYSCIATGYGAEAKLLEKEFIKSDDKRIQYSNESAQTVANEILSSNSDGVSPWIIQPNTTGLFDTDWGDVSLRFEYANRLNCLVKLSEAIDYEWWVSQTNGDPSEDLFNIAEYRPSTTRATVSQETFAISGADANCWLTTREKDITNIINKIDVLGYGDGINQIHTSTYNASSTYSTLASDITSSSTTITLADASGFASSGEIRIMEERVTYSGKSGNNLTGCTRGANSTTARAHKKNVFVEKYIVIASAESESSIGDNGLIDYTITNKDLIDLETAELIASRELLEKMDAIERITVQPSEPLQVAGSRDIGDLVTITDTESSLSSDYRIVGMTYESNYGDLSLEIECSNRSLTFIEQMQKQKENADNMSKYMQGATNIYAINEVENCDDTHALNLRFFIPNEAVAINKVLLNFKLEDYRAYEGSNASESSHTHGFSAVSDYATSNNISGTMSTSTWEDTGGSVNVDVSTGENVLVIYSMGLDQSNDPPIDEMDLRIQRDIGGGGYSTLNESISYWVPGEATTNQGIWSASGDSFMSGNPDTDQITYGGDSGTVTAQVNTTYFHTPVYLPNGAIVTSVICYGNAGASAETWELERVNLSTLASTSMASANFNSSDTTISNATIDNDTYMYHIITTSLDTNDVIYGVEIKYTNPSQISGDIATFDNTLSKTILDSPSAGSVTYKLQINGTSGNQYGLLGSGTLTAVVFNNSTTTDVGSSHTHGINYGIYEENLTNPSVDLSVGIEGSESAVGTYTTDQTDLDITSEVSAVGAGNWVNIKFDANKNMRIGANAYVQIFIDSKI